MAMSLLLACSADADVQINSNADVNVDKDKSKIDTNSPKGVQPFFADNNNPDIEWELDFTDEFNDEVLNRFKWTKNNSSKSRAARPKIGVKNWYWKPENVRLQDGKLILEVVKHDRNTMHCGGVFSKDKYETTYGYMEARIKIADAYKGTHTAFWLQGKGMSNVDGTANDGAEIDIFESAWLKDFTKCVVHIDGYGSNHKANTKKYNTPGIHEGYHVFGLHWSKDFMKIYYDGVLKASYTGDSWIVHANEYLWLSNGASFGIEGDYFTSQPNGTLTFAQVDYLRVWKQK
ncbi:glycoside hydrolase family 16 protein [Marinifilum sp.]|uniref:glycoside hydrolase family 16 protein n=1 Tax=Marinifilum sp. TaxID=2033137 RepID=UPI003BA8FF4B